MVGVRGVRVGGGTRCSAGVGGLGGVSKRLVGLVCHVIVLRRRSARKFV